MSNHEILLSGNDAKEHGFVTLLTPPSFLQEIIEKKGSYSKIIIAKDDNKKIVGYLIALMKNDCELNFFMNNFTAEVDRSTPKKPDNTMYIAQINVSKNYQRKGAGKKMYQFLFDYLDDIFEEFYVESIITEVSNENIPSYKFHQSLGFKKIYHYPLKITRNSFSILEKRGSITMHIT